MANVIQGGPMPIVVVSQEAAALRGPQGQPKVSSTERAKRNGPDNRYRERDDKVNQSDKGKKVNLQV